MANGKRPTILICDDEAAFHIALKQQIREFADVRSAYTGDEALAIVRNQAIDIILLDVQIRSDREGIEYIRKLHAEDPELAILMNTSVRDYAVVREALKAGATDYLVKGEDADALVLTLQRTLEKRSLLQAAGRHTYETSNSQKRNHLIGNSSALTVIRKQIEKFRRSPGNVLIWGETGTGKEVVARLLRSQLPDGSWEPFVAIDSSTIQSSTAESILFGHEKGAFTGADRQQKGVFEEANGGIVYFDEIANMPLSIQLKLLRVLQEKEVMRLGSSKTIPLDFRVVAATNRDLEDLCKKGEFKEDLFQRLNVLPLSLPPLRDRKEDLPALCEHLLNTLGPKRRLHFSEEAMAYLHGYDWPGNIRELGNVILYVTATADGDTIEASDLPPKFRNSVEKKTLSERSEKIGFYEHVAEFERTFLANAIQNSDGNLSKLALTLGMDRSHLYAKIKEYGLEKKKKT